MFAFFYWACYAFEYISVFAVVVKVARMVALLYVVNVSFLVLRLNTGGGGGGFRARMK